MSLGGQTAVLFETNENEKCKASAGCILTGDEIAWCWKFAYSLEIAVSLLHIGGQFDLISLILHFPFRTLRSLVLFNTAVCTPHEYSRRNILRTS